MLDASLSYNEKTNAALRVISPSSAVKARTQEHNAPAFVDTLIGQALARRASDIHLEPTWSGMRIRFRIDGLLQDAGSIPAEDWPGIVARIKIMSRLDIAEHRIPQDGRLRIPRSSGPVDARVSTVPSLHGEKVVLRLLDLKATAIPLDRVGLADNQIQEFRGLIRRPQGIVFVTGPTGSGKTSTIYASLNEIKSEAINIVTIEDPIEYEMQRVTQIPVQEKIGLTFAACLRSVLRQDPDVILVGEVRDVETARIAMQASLTGHMVFATLHTNDAVGAITRLLDMEIPLYLIAASMTAVVAQRLVRIMCPACKTPWEPDAAARVALGLTYPSTVLYRPNGCKQCHGTGAVGRKGIFELLPITPAMRALINKGGKEEELRSLARTAGMVTMWEDGVRKVLAGTVAYEELLRVTEPDASPAPNASLIPTCSD